MSGVLNSAELYDPAAGTWSGDRRPGPDAPSTPRRCCLQARCWWPEDILAVGCLTRNRNCMIRPLRRGVRPATLAPHATSHGDAAALGQVLVAGGDTSVVILDSAELYDPAAGTWNATDSLITARRSHTATLLPSGKVLVAGGLDSSANPLSSAELYDPATGMWSSTGSMSTARFSTRQRCCPQARCWSREEPMVVP